MKTKFSFILFLALAAIAFVSCSDDPNLKAGFTYSPEGTIQAGDTVYFTNTSSEASTFEWSFGDGEKSTEESPWHIYDEPGIYSVTLNAMNGEFKHSATKEINIAVDFAYIINYGSYSGDKSTVTAYNTYDEEVINGYYKTVNGLDMVSNVQYACNYEGNIYFMDNNADGISWVNAKTFEQTENAISSDIVKPRYCVGHGDYLYVSCYGGDVWYDSSLGYIAKINLNTNNVEKINLPGGPEGLAIVDGKLYVALRYGKSIGVVDLTTEAVSNIDFPGQPVFFEKDPQDNLYVVISRNWDDYATQTGVGYFNTHTNTLDATYALDGIGNTYDNVIDANSDFSKLYVSYTTSTDYSTYVSTGSIAVFDVASKQFESSNLVDGIVGVNGLQVVDDKIISFEAPSTTSNGKAVIYSNDGQEMEEYETGISPILMVESK
ncbi:PKD domain-containing protein [Prolixibacteraceae bacterium Z1-6]|uniref:PKD domain-containing protein n=1 Tax=Draconibacterium aestuarii TaxID=2998507 RepID=A0A9X3F491_9BACT|nr:PKD domain-containing protein [Prolixibacteraceae bacterium Z1-6]